VDFSLGCFGGAVFDFLARQQRRLRRVMGPGRWPSGVFTAVVRGLNAWGEL